MRLMSSYVLALVIGLNGPWVRSHRVEGCGRFRRSSDLSETADERKRFILCRNPAVSGGFSVADRIT